MKKLLLFSLFTLVACLLCSMSAAEAEAYACYTSSNTTLTFYYDNLRSSRSGTTYDLNTGYDWPGWRRDGNNASVTRVVFDSSFAGARPTSTHLWFGDMVHLTSITGMKQYLNTSSVTDMGSMFYWCKAMTNFDLSGFNTAQVKDMEGMFMGCSNLRSLDLSGFNTAQVTEMDLMFDDCSSLTSIDLSSFNTSSVTQMDYMFDNCSGLTSLDLSNFNTAQVTTMYCMFRGCSGLTNLDLSTFNTAQVTNMQFMFQDCSDLETIYVRSGWSTDAVTATGSEDMFLNCTNLMGGQGTTYNSSHVDKAYAHIDGGTSNPGYLTAPTESYACYTPSNTTLTFYRDNMRFLREGTTYDLNTGRDDPGWYSMRNAITRVIFNESFAGARPTTTYMWFSDMKNLDTICNIENLNTVDVTVMSSMFNSCSKLKNIDLSHFNTGNVTSMSSMFNGCESLSSLDVSSFVTGHVTDMCKLFSYCKSLTNLDLRSFSVSRASDMRFMFSGCSSLKTLNLSSFYIRDNLHRYMQAMFSGCSSLTTIYGTDWMMDHVIDYALYLFEGCNSLVGEQGSSFAEYGDGNSYARVDGGPYFPGYFSTWREPYAMYDSNSNTLYFHYDDGKFNSTRPTYELNTGDSIPGWNDISASITRVYFDISFQLFRPTSTYMWFSGMTNLDSIANIEYLITDSVTNMQRMFEGCSKVRRLDLNLFNTANVTDMSYMFKDCSALTDLRTSTSFSATHVTDMAGMFWGCSSMTSIDVSGFQTVNATNMNSMFRGCSNLSDLDLTRFYPGNVRDMDYMFEGCTALTSLNLQIFNTENVTSMNGMFSNCSNLTTIYATDLWTTESVTTSSDMFAGCTSIVGRMGTTYDPAHVDATYAHIDDGPSNPGYLNADTESYACYTPNNTTLTFYRDNMRYSREGTTYELNDLNMYRSSTRPGWYAVRSDVTRVIFDPSFGYARPRTTHEWFSGMYNLDSIIGIEYLNTYYVKEMDYMFTNCSKLTSIDLSHFYTTYATDMSYMFSGCRRLTSLDLSRFNGEMMTNMSYMFNNCTALMSLDLSAFNTSKVTSMSYMFNNCTGLTSLDLSTFNTSKVTNMSYMFNNCTGLTSLDLSNFDTSRASNMSYMFNGCTGLTSLDLSNFSLYALVSTISNMFYGCSELTTIYANKEWKVLSMTNSDSMFRGCTKLVGGKGTTYDSSHTNYLYARIDMGPSLPGYFTEKLTAEAYACYTSDNTTLTFYFDSQRNSREGTTYDLNVGAHQPDWVVDGTYSSVNQVVIDPSFAEARPTSTYSWFFCMENVQSITGLDYLNTDSVTNMAAMFMGCTGLTSLDLSSFNTTMVADMFHMFYECSNLASLDVSSFNTAKVRDMRGMFRNCSKLTSLDLSSFNTAKVENMSMMFSGDSQLVTIYAADGWSIAEDTYVSSMFENCTSLVGGMGTTYDPNHVDGEYAHIDGGSGDPGYFTAKAGGQHGDVNGDGIVNISDATALINLLLSASALPSTADINQDGIVNISDATALINFLLGGNWN